MKVLVNRVPVSGPWGGGNLLVKSLFEILPEMGVNITSKLEEGIDLIFMQDPRYGDTGISINEIIRYKSQNPGTKIVHRVNECDARKGTEGVDNLLSECSKYTDHTVFVSNWMKKYHIKNNWMCDSSVIYNGVNKDHFSPGEKIKNGKINIVTHHWSNNRMKGFDVYDWIDSFVGQRDDFTFTYIGRENGTFKNSKVIQPLFGKDLGDCLSKYDVYISGSLFDPGPNHILESLACNIPTYVYADGGGCVEFAGKSHAFDSFENLEKLLISKDYKNNEMTPQTWSECMVKYLDLFRNLTNI